MAFRFTCTWDLHVDINIRGGFRIVLAYEFQKVLKQTSSIIDFA